MTQHRHGLRAKASPRTRTAPAAKAEKKVEGSAPRHREWIAKLASGSRHREARSPHDIKVSGLFAQLFFALHEAADDGFLGQDAPLVALAAEGLHGLMRALQYRDRATLQQVLKVTNEAAPAVDDSTLYPSVQHAEILGSVGVPTHRPRLAPNPGRAKQLEALEKYVQEVLDRENKLSCKDQNFGDICVALLRAVDGVTPLGVEIPLASDEIRMAKIAKALGEAGASQQWTEARRLISCAFRALGMPERRARNLWSASIQAERRADDKPDTRRQATTHSTPE